MPDILTAAEMAELAQLDQERTQGKWKARSSRRGDDWGLLDIADTVIVEAFKQVGLGDYRNAEANAAFIAACSVAVPKLLATIETLRSALPPGKKLREISNYPRTDDRPMLREWADRIEAIEKAMRGEK